MTPNSDLVALGSLPQVNTGGYAVVRMRKPDSNKNILNNYGLANSQYIGTLCIILPRNTLLVESIFFIFIISNQMPPATPYIYHAKSHQ